MRVLNDAHRLKYGVTQVKDKEAQHERYGILAVDQKVSNHDPDIQHQFQDNGQKEGVDEFYEPSGKGLNEVIIRKQ